MIRRRTTLFAALILLSALTVSCDPQDFFPVNGGNYDGFLIARTDQGTDQKFVTATLKPAGQGLYDLAADDQGGQNVFHCSIALEKRSVKLALDGGQPVELQPSGDHCLETKGHSPWMRLCYDRSEVSLDSKDEKGAMTTLIIDPRTAATVPKMESPGTYTKNQLMERAINQSFTSRIEFEKVVQAKLNARLQTLNLLPHFTTNDILNMASPSLTGFFKSVGDLAPFLLPDRWLRAAESQEGYEAELYGWITMKADAANIVEGLTYALLYQQASINQLEANEKLISDIRDQIKEREQAGIVQIGSSDDITTVVNSVEQTINALKGETATGYASLAQAAGFFNPKAISGLIETQEEKTVDTPDPIDETQLTRIALERSFELRQFDELMQMAGREKSARFFNWLDPNGDSSGGLGFGFPTYIKIADVKKTEIAVERQQEQSLITEKIDQVFSDMTAAENQWNLAVQGKQIEERRIARITDNMTMGVNYALADLVTALQGRVRNDLLLTEARFHYLLAWSKLNRLLYSGPYSYLSRGTELSPEFDQEVSH